MKIIKRGFFAPILLLVLAVSLPFSVQAQKADVNVSGFQNHKLASKLMNREMPYRVILPVNYNNANEKNAYSVIYLLHGLTGHFDNWTDRTKLVEYAKNYNYVIVTPEGDNGWYSDSAAAANDKYESYIVRELIPEIDKKFRTLANRENRAIAGLSMGGYGAVKFGLKYPEMFSIVGSFSGALGAASLSAKNAGAIGKSIDQIFGGDSSENRRVNDIFRMVREISPEKIKTLPFIYLDCGTEDFLFQNNREFAALLADKKIPHEFRQLPGKHDWNFWNLQVLEFLEVSEKVIKSAKAQSVK